MTDHDQFFKELLTTFFWEFMELFLPDVLEYLEPDSVTFLDKEIFTDVTSGERLEADLLVQARWRGQETFLLFHIESQAQPQEDFAARMFHYFAPLHKKFRLPVYPIALLSFATPRTPQPDVYRVVFPDLPVLEFRFRVIQLNRMNWRDFLNTPNPVASALMAKMRIAKRDRPRVKAECLRLLATLQLNPAKMQLIFGFVDAYLRLNAEEDQEFRQTLAQIAPESEEKIMPLMGNSEERGWLRGLQEGQQAGYQAGGQSVIVYLLEHRIGPLDEAAHQQIAALSLEQLQKLSLAALDFSLPEDLQQWFDQHLVN